MSHKNIDILKRFRIGIRRGVSKALAEHKRLGNSIAIWQDGKVVIVPAEEIVVPPYPEDDELDGI